MLPIIGFPEEIKWHMPELTCRPHDAGGCQVSQQLAYQAMPD